MKAIALVFPGCCSPCSHHLHNAIELDNECMGVARRRAYQKRPLGPAITFLKENG
jgi:hypothetical protein